MLIIIIIRSMHGHIWLYGMPWYYHQEHACCMVGMYYNKSLCMCYIRIIIRIKGRGALTNLWVHCECLYDTYAPYNYNEHSVDCERLYHRYICTQTDISSVEYARLYHRYCTYKLIVNACIVGMHLNWFCEHSVDCEWLYHTYTYGSPIEAISAVGYNFFYI